MYSSHIKLRIAALSKLQTNVESGLGSERDVDAILVAASMGLKEHQAPHVFMCALHLLDAVIVRLGDNQTPLASSPSAQPLANAAVDALGSSSAQVADAAQHLVTEKLIRVLGSLAMVKSLLRPPMTSRGKKSTLWRPLHARLLALGTLVDSAPELFQPDAVLDWMIKVCFWSKTTRRRD